MTIEDEDRLLTDFSDGDEKRAVQALTALEYRARPFLSTYLRRAGVNAEQIEDTIQETLTAIWRYRTRFRPSGKAAWYTLLKRVAHQRLLDVGRRSYPTVPLLEDLEPADFETEIDVRLLERQSVSELTTAADCMLLGLDPREPATNRQARLLALQLFYLDGAAWQEVLALTSPAFPRYAWPTRAILDTWLTDPALLRLLAFRQLHSVGARFLETVGCKERAMKLATSDTCRSPQYSAADLQVLEWRLRFGLSWEQISGRRDCPLAEEEIADLRVSLGEHSPFEREMRSLMDLIDHSPAGLSALKHLGLWQRLAFEYWYVDGLSQPDLLERIAPPADLLELRLTAEAVNMWLSGGRLAKRLAGHLRTTDAHCSGESFSGVVL